MTVWVVPYGLFRVHDGHERVLTNLEYAQMFSVPAQSEVEKSFLAALQRDARVSQATVLTVQGFFDGRLSLSNLSDSQRAIVHRKAVVYQVKRVSNAQ